MRHRHNDRRTDSQTDGDTQINFPTFSESRELHLFQKWLCFNSSYTGIFIMKFVRHYLITNRLNTLLT